MTPKTPDETDWDQIMRDMSNIIEKLNVNYITPTPRLTPAPPPGTLERMLRVAQSIGVLI